jgi:hypothetical protein
VPARKKKATGAAATAARKTAKPKVAVQDAAAKATAPLKGARGA